MFDYYFKDLDFIPDAIILGCTHFPLISNALSSYFKHKPILIHSGEAIVKYLNEQGIKRHSNIEPNLKIFASDNVSALRETAKIWLGNR